MTFDVFRGFGSSGNQLLDLISQLGQQDAVGQASSALLGGVDQTAASLDPLVAAPDQQSKIEGVLRALGNVKVPPPPKIPAPPSVVAPKLGGRAADPRLQQILTALLAGQQAAPQATLGSLIGGSVRALPLIR